MVHHQLKHGHRLSLGTPVAHPSRLSNPKLPLYQVGSQVSNIFEHQRKQHIKRELAQGFQQFERPGQKSQVLSITPSLS